MLADLTIVPLGSHANQSDALPQIVKTVESSGLKYQLTPTATCLEGEWDQIMVVAKQCHQAARVAYPHVLTLLRIEDDGAGPRPREEGAPVKNDLRPNPGA